MKVELTNTGVKIDGIEYAGLNIPDSIFDKLTDDQQTEIYDHIFYLETE